MSVVETEYEKLPPRHRKPWSSSRRDDSLENSSRQSVTDSGRSSPSLSSNTSAMPPLKRVYSERNVTGKTWKIDAFSTLEDIESFLQSPPPTSDNSEGGADNSTDPNSVVSQSQPEIITPKDDLSLISRSASNTSELQPEIKSDAAGPSTPALSRTSEAPTEITENSSQATTFQFNTPGQTSELLAPSMDRSTSLLKHKFPPRLLSDSSPSTRSNSPALRPSGSSLSPSKWASAIPTGSRRSSRRFEVRPWGPRHLEYDYSQARKEFQSAAYYALGQYGYVPPKGHSKTIVSTTDTLPSMADLKKIKAFRKACERLDETDRLLEEALEKGLTWDNTPVPKEYMNLALDVNLDSKEMKPENIGIRRVSEKTRTEEEEEGLEAKRKRSRSSVTLEEEAGSINISTPQTTAPPPPKRRGRPPKKKP